MMYVEPKKAPVPRYKGTVVCGECHAECQPGNWWVVSYDGTSSLTTWRYPLLAGCCPHCRMPQS